MASVPMTSPRWINGTQQPDCIPREVRWCIASGDSARPSDCQSAAAPWCGKLRRRENLRWGGERRRRWFPSRPAPKTAPTNRRRRIKHGQRGCVVGNDFADACGNGCQELAHIHIGEQRRTELKHHCFFRPLAIGKVARDLGVAGDLARIVVDGAEDAVGPEAGTSLRTRQPSSSNRPRAAASRINSVGLPRSTSSWVKKREKCAPTISSAI